MEASPYETLLLHKKTSLKLDWASSYQPETSRKGTVDEDDLEYTLRVLRICHEVAQSRPYDLFARLLNVHVREMDIISKRAYLDGDRDYLSSPMTVLRRPSRSSS